MPRHIGSSSLRGIARDLYNGQWAQGSDITPKGVSTKVLY